MIYAVVVAYRAEPAAVLANLALLAGQVSGIIVVDNSSSADAGRWAGSPPVTAIMNGQNLGVAAALNQGIRQALGQGAELVLLLDEDSRPEAGMLPELLRVYHARVGNADQIAALGPDFVERHSGRHGLFARAGRWRMQRLSCVDAVDGVVESDYLMTSGSLIPAKAFGSVGPMNEHLFIDLVDTDWCLRARYLGWRCLGVCTAKMEHSFGEGRISLGAGRSIPSRAPVRSYYAVRNGIQLMKQDYCPRAWKLNECKRLVLTCLALLIAAPQRLSHLRFMAAGLRDGLLNRGGPGPAGLDGSSGS